MKKIIRLGALLAVAATAFTACQNNPTDTESSEQPRIRLTLRAGNPQIAPDAAAQGTRTEMEGTTPYWSVGDRIGVSTDGTSVNYPFTNDATERAQTTTFSGTVSVGSTLYTYYPYSDNGISGTGDNAGARVDIPVNQYPTATSFDGKADLLIGKPLAMAADGTVLGNLQFKRMGAILKVVLKDNSTGGLLAGQHVSSLTFSAGGDNYLAGRVTLNLKEGLLLDPYYKQSDKVTAIYTTATQYAVDGQSATYLGVFPRVLAAGTTLTVQASTEGYEISRTLTLEHDVDLKTSKVTTLRIGLADEHITPVATGLALPFTDDFSDLTGNGSSPNISTRKDHSGNLLYSASANVYQYNVPHGLRISTSSNSGYITTTDLNLSQPFSVLVSARAWTKDVTALKVTAGETETMSTANLTEEFQTYIMKFEAQGPKTKIRIEPATNNKRLIIESIQIIAGHDIHLPAELHLTSETTLTVAADGDIVTTTYTIENPVTGASITADAGDATWINSFDYGTAGEVSYLIDANDTDAARTAVITFSYADATPQTVTVTQRAPLKQLDAPGNLTVSATGALVSASWTADTHAKEYAWRIAATAAPDTDVQSGKTAEANVSVSNLAAGTEYTFYVKSVGDGIQYLTSSESSRTVTTEQLPKLSMPAVTIDASATTSNSLTVTWATAVTGAIGFQWTATPTDTAKATKSGSTDDGTATSIVATGLEAETEYTVSVIARGNGTSNVNSDPQTTTPATTAVNNRPAPVSFTQSFTKAPSSDPAFPTGTKGGDFGPSTQTDYTFGGYTWSLFKSYFHTGVSALWFNTGYNAYIVTPRVEGLKLVSITVDTSGSATSAVWDLRTENDVKIGSFTNAATSTVNIPADNQADNARFKIVQTASKNGRIKSIILNYE